MTEKTEKFWTGSFVILGLILFIFSFLALTSEESFVKRKDAYYTLVDDAQGILFGSMVSFSGIDIGHVSNITYVPESQKIRIDFKVSKKYSPFLTTNSLVSLKTQGALGDRFVYISTQEPGGKILENGSLIAADNKPDIMDQIGSKLSDFEQLSSTLKKVDLIITSLLEGADFKTLGKNMEITFKNLAQATSGISPTVHYLNSFLDAINSQKGTLGQLIYDPTIHNKIVNLLGEEKEESYLHSLMQKSIETRESQ